MKNSFFWNVYARLYDTLKYLTPYRDLHDQVLDALNLNGDEKILDAGCGTGNFEKLLIEKGIDSIQIEALDFSQAMLKRARQKNGNHNFDFQQFDLNNKLPFPDSHFDKIVSVNAVYALKDPGATIQEFTRVLKPKGKIIIASPQKNAGILPILFEHMKNGDKKAILLSFPALLFVGLLNLVIMKNGQDGKYHFFTKEELADLFYQNNFTINKIIPAYANQAWLIAGEKKG